MEADPLAIVEIVGMAGHASIWIEDWDARVADPRRACSARRARASAVTALIHPLAVQAHLDLRRGRWAPALAGASESAELAEDTGQLALLPHALAALTPGRGGPRPRGRLPRARRARAGARASATATPSTSTPRSGLLELGLGRIPEAIEALETGDRQMLRRGLSSAVVQLRAGPDRGLRARRPARGGRGAARGSGADARPATGGAGRARPRRAAAGCSRPTPSSAAAFEAALALHDGLPMPFERARTQLALGERLRRAKQRAEAREPLTAALDAFERLGARPWAERARTELRATGGQASGRRAQAARRAADAARAADRACWSRRA